MATLIPPTVSPYSFSDLASPKTVATNKLALYNALVANGFDQALTWEDASVPSGLVEIQANGLTNLQQATQSILFAGINSLAGGAALASLSNELYDNQYLPGQTLVGVVVLSDGGAGPFTFDVTSKWFSVGQGGLLYQGIADPSSGQMQYTLPLNGTVQVYIQATDVGGKFNVGAGAINTFARGRLPGVTVTNPINWNSTLAPNCQLGADKEQDSSIQLRNQTKWATLGTGSPASAYINWCKNADVSITKVAVFANISMLDAGTVYAIIGSDSGGASSQAVLNAQNYIAQNQIGGSLIPETARCVVASAVPLPIPIIATLYVPGALNTSAFFQQIVANIATFQAALQFGQKVSWARVLQITSEAAGLDPNTIEDEDWISPSADVQPLYYQIGVLDPIGADPSNPTLQLVSV